MDRNGSSGELIMSVSAIVPEKSRVSVTNRKKQNDKIFAFLTLL